ncbi:hypothetical protein [Corallococcus sp. 4LFB]|uniref:hypothetical protein n=1 Tax=Corallococcus sp. 4LFB TaxID=3383249 RepID=UPI0039765396
MSGREVQLAAGRKSARQTRSASARAWTLTLVIAASLGLLLYVATTSLPYLIASPAGDAHLGALNDCLARQLKGATRLGWAVAPDASRAAVFGPRVVAVCGEDGSHARLEVPGAPRSPSTASATCGSPPEAACCVNGTARSSPWATSLRRSG